MAVDNWEETKNKLYSKYRELTHTVIQYLDCMIDGYKIRIIYSRRNNIELILLIFYRGENFYINEASKIGKGKFYRPSPNAREIFEFNDEYITNKIEYIGEIENFKIYEKKV